MGIEKGFDQVTDAQRVRDAEYIEVIRRELVAPLLEDLEAAIPNYKAMGEAERFVELMKLNEPHALEGFYLPLDFGSIDGFGQARGAVFSGCTNLHAYHEKGGAKIYQPLFEDYPVGTSGSLISDIGFLISPPDGFGEGLGKVYTELPLPYRIAVVALCIKQNVVVSPVKACRFAAGWDETLEPRRWVAHSVQGSTFQRFGWLIAIRDTTPSNDFCKHLGGTLRSIVSRQTESFPGWIDKDGEHFPLYSADKTNKRTRRDSTKALMDYFDRYLPEHGLYVGRSGNGERISWKRAYKLFNDLHPNIYKSDKSFRNAYFNARKAREGR